MSAEQATFPKGRVEALSDGIFAVAMTILVLDLRLPEVLEVNSQKALWLALLDLQSKVVPYLLSFYVLGSDWLALSKLQAAWKEMTRIHARWTLLYLLLVTLLPFTTTIVGRYGVYPLATGVYLGNMAAVAGVFILLLPRPGEPAIEGDWSVRRTGLWLFIATCALAVTLSFFIGEQALLLLALNAVIPRLARRIHRGKA